MTDTPKFLTSEYFQRKIAELPKISFRHVIGGFNRELETEYSADYFASSLRLIRLALVLSAVLVASFGVLDIWIVPVTRQAAWIIRFAVILPAIAVCFAMSFLPFFKKIMQPTLCLSTLIVGLGFCAMVALIGEAERGFYLYYVGIIQVLIAAYALLRIRFLYASIVGWVLVAGYEIAAIVWNGMLASPDRFPIFLNNNFFLVSTNIMGMIAGYFIEYYLRHTFLLRQRIHLEEEMVIERTQAELAKTRQELGAAQTTLQAMEIETDTVLESISNTINHKHAAQRELNQKATELMLAIKGAARELGDKVPQALMKSVRLVLDGFERQAAAECARSGGPGPGLPAALKEAKEKIANLFERQHLGSVVTYIGKKIQGYSGDTIDSLEKAFNNMNGIMAYINAILDYQRGREIALEEHAQTPLQHVYFSIQNTYRKELADYRIAFVYDNRTDGLVVLPVYDFILEEDIVRNLFLNSFRALVEGDPENKRRDKKIWIEVSKRREAGAAGGYLIHFRDNGPGIPADKKRDIFEGYSTKRGARTEPGVGCRTLKKRVAEMGGTIIEAGVPGKGADFIITIPRRAERPPSRPSLDAGAHDQAGGPAWAGAGGQAGD